MKKFLSVILVILMILTALPTNLFSMSAQALSSNDVKSKMDSFMQKYPKGAQNPWNECYDFINELTKEIFNHSLPSQHDSKYKFKDNYKDNFVQIGETLAISKSNLTQETLADLLSQSLPGDVIQMHYTTYKGQLSYHVMAVYSASKTGIVLYHAGRYKDRNGDSIKERGKIYFGVGTGSDKLNGSSGKEMPWSDFINLFSNSKNGISLYRSKKSDFSCATHNYTTTYESAHPHAEYKICKCGSKIYTGNHKKETNCSLCKNPLSYSFDTVDGKTVYTYSKQYDVTVTIFSHNQCNNGKKLIQAIAQNSTLLKNTTQVLFVDANKNTKQTVSALKKSLGTSKVEFCYDLSDKAYNAMWKYANVAGFGDSITLPIIVFTKKDGTVFKVLQGEVEPDYFFQLAKGDLSQDMSVNLNISGTENYNYANEVLKKLNDLRKRLNLQALTMDQSLLTAAMQRAAEISIYYSHTRPNGTSCKTVSNNIKIKAENIAIGQKNPADVMTSWTNSSVHYANMTDTDVKSVGIGCFATSEGYLCWVQVFSKDSPTAVSKSGTVSAARVIKANAAHISLALYADKDPHLLKKGESTKLRVENTNKGFNYVVQKLNISDFNLKSNNNVVKVDTNRTCTANGTGKVTVTAEHKQSESVKLLGLYTVGHSYTNSCDATCNVCGAKRTTTHTYSNNHDTKCNICKATRTITHAYKTTTTKATLTKKDGSIVKKCTVCGKVASNTAIKYVKTFKLSTTSYTYDGKVKTPSVTVKDSAGKLLKKNTDYTVTYASGRKNAGTYKVTIKMIGKYSGTKTLTFKINPAKLSSYKLTTTAYTYDGETKTPSVTVKNASGVKLTKNTHYTVAYSSGRKNVGTYKVTIKGKGNYTGTKTLTFKINPAKTKVSKLTAGKKSITVAITKKPTQVTGYQIQYSTSKTFSKVTTKTISNYKTTKYTLKSLSPKKTYYVRVRTYKKVGKTKYYSGWSTYKCKKTK